ncbi:hypothetical protein AZF37_01295 [endosymbiont 'TC1' of Trimyema compressum]|uniref:hypothetical protein n=1 Tax=endosymbiont 'TC1' of Trimyema compressum TaxID=243899 RepID=UPI0007F0A259|nr:hypothetical protein [endosymbiont 'TC1' of Trimyema compressum]AMP19995.1 hypothetical protein AZF37_01295 [endosymbiont 'TC1' of Trimyema compressum]
MHQKELVVSNFDVEDGGGGNRAINNPDIAYNIIPVENVQSFVVLTKNNTTVLNIDFNYKAFQFEPTAKIIMRISDNEVGEPIVAEPQDTKPEPVKETLITPASTRVVNRNTDGFKDRIIELQILLLKEIKPLKA